METEDAYSEWYSLNNEEEAYSNELERLEFNKRTMLGGSGSFVPLISFGAVLVLLSMCIAYPAKKC